MEIFHIISNRRRRQIICYISEHGETSYSDLAEEIATWEDGPEYTAAQRKSVYVNILQRHSEKLEDHGVAEIGGRERSLVPTETTDVAAEAIHEVREMFGMEDESITDT